jgi:class 3 adenylate cyclase
MRTAMVLHDELVEVTVAAHSGMIVRPRGEGDSRFAVFRRASDGEAAGAQIVDSVRNQSWDTPTPIRVRVGVHTGEVVPLSKSASRATSDTGRQDRKVD